MTVSNAFAFWHFLGSSCITGPVQQHVIYSAMFPVLIIAAFVLLVMSLKPHLHHSTIQIFFITPFSRLCHIFMDDFFVYFLAPSLLEFISDVPVLLRRAIDCFVNTLLRFIFPSVCLRFSLSSTFRHVCLRKCNLHPRYFSGRHLSIHWQ